MIYFARLATGAIKIGTAVDPLKRMQELARFYESPVILLEIMPGDAAEEREVHRMFRHLRLGGKEQFRPGADLLKFLCLTAEGWPDPETVCPQLGRNLKLEPILRELARIRRERAAGAAGKAVAMRARDVEIGGTYKARVSDRWADVRIAGAAPVGEKGWMAVNIATGRAVRIRSARRLWSAEAYAAREAEHRQAMADFHRAHKEVSRARAARRRARAARRRGVKP